MNIYIKYFVIASLGWFLHSFSYNQDIHTVQAVDLCSKPIVQKWIGVPLTGTVADDDE